MNQSKNFEQSNITPTEQQPTPEIPVAEVRQEITIEASPEAHAEVAETEISQEAASIAVEGNQKIEDAGQSFDFSDEALRGLRNEYHIDEQLSEINAEAETISREAKSEIDSVKKSPEDSVDARAVQGDNGGMENHEPKPQENAVEIGHDKEQGRKDYRLRVVDSSLQIAEQAVREKQITSKRAMDGLFEDIAKAKEAGADLSHIENLEARAIALENSAASTEIEGSLNHLDDVMKAEGSNADVIQAIGSWYWFAFGKLQEYQDALTTDQKNAFVAKLNTAAAEAGAKYNIPYNTIPPYEQKSGTGTEKPLAEWRDYLGASSDEEAMVAEKMSDALVDAITSQDSRSIEKIIGTINRAEGRSSLFGGESSKDLESLKLIDVPITGDIYQDTLTLGEQIKDPDIAYYLSQGTPPQEILNEVKRGIQEWLDSNRGQKQFGTLHSMIMIRVIDKILAADKLSERKTGNRVSFEFAEGGEPRVKVSPEKMGELENLRKMSLWDLHLMQEKFIDDLRSGRAVDSESRLILMDVILEKQREARDKK